jgi:hypothetical protein
MPLADVITLLREAIPKPEPVAGASQLSDDTLGHLLADLEGWEHAYEATIRIAEQKAVESPVEAPHWFAQAGAFKFLPDTQRMPGIDRIALLCDELFGGTGLTVENIRQLRVRVCRKLHCQPAQADALSLEETADVLENIERVSIETLNAMQPCLASDQLTTIDLLITPNGSQIPVYWASCRIVPDKEPSICPKADPSIPAEFLPLVLQAFNRFPGRVPAGHTIHWIGHRAWRRNACTCYGQAPTAPVNYAQSELQGANLGLHCDTREYCLDAPVGTPSPLKEAFETVAKAVSQAAEIRQSTSTTRIVFDDQARELANALAAARQAYALAELQLQASALDRTCAHRDALNVVIKVNDVVGHVMLNQVPFDQAAAHIRSAPTFDVAKLISAMRRQISHAAIQVKSASEPAHDMRQQEEDRKSAQTDNRSRGKPRRQRKDGGWLTVAEAAQISGINKGIISRAVDDGDLKSNGKKLRARRIDGTDFNRWQLARANKLKSMESDEQVRKLLDRAND